MESPNMKAVKEVWSLFERDGTRAGIECMLLHCHEEVELRPYFADGRTFHGVEEIRGFFREREAARAKVHVSPWSFEESGDDIVVSGSIRVERPDGSIADAQLRWTYGFRDGLIRRAEVGPLVAAASR